MPLPEHMTSGGIKERHRARAWDDEPLGKREQPPSAPPGWILGLDDPHAQGNAAVAGHPSANPAPQPVEAAEPACAGEIPPRPKETFRIATSIKVVAIQAIDRPHEQKPAQGRDINQRRPVDPGKPGPAPGFTDRDGRGHGPSQLICHQKRTVAIGEDRLSDPGVGSPTAHHLNRNRLHAAGPDSIGFGPR